MSSTTVIIPALVTNASLVAAIQSALNQRLAPGEIIVVASVPEPPATLAPFEGAVRWLAAPAGMATAGALRNHAAAKAAGHWLAFLDAADRWHPEKLAQQHAALTASGASWSYTALDGGPAPHSRDGATPLAALLAGRPPQTSSVVVNRAAFFSAGGFAADVPAGEAFPLWLALARRGWAALVPAPLTVANRLTLSPEDERAALATELAALHDLRMGGELPWTLRLATRRAIARRERRAGHLALAGGERVAARRHAAAALSLDPLHPGTWHLWLGTRGG